MFGNDPQSSSGTDIKPVENSVGEVKVVTGTLPAEYGHTTGGVVTVVKKGGTNEIHGLAADLGRTRRMTHRQFFNTFKTSDPQPGAPDGVPAWFMMPDANIGGPVFIPKVYDGRNKTFFFFGYQKLIEKKSATFTSQTPTPAEIGGDFTFGGASQQIYDPLTTRQNADGTWTRSDSGQHHPGQPVRQRVAENSLVESVDSAEHARFVDQHWSGEQLYLGIEIPHLLRGYVDAHRSTVQPRSEGLWKLDVQPPERPRPSDQCRPSGVRWRQWNADAVHAEERLESARPSCLGRQHSTKSRSATTARAKIPWFRLSTEIGRKRWGFRMTTGC